MLSIQDITVAFGGRFLFEEISFLVTKGDRIGLVGKNGAGKSTLLRIISGMIQPTSGIISMPKDATLGFLTQDIVKGSEKPVMEELLSSQGELNDLRHEIDFINHALETRTDYESEQYGHLLNRLGHCTERYAMLDGYEAIAQSEKVLLGLGFRRSDFEQPCNTFSGGWRMRIELARLLVNRPDILLLDEPTNHLDIESIQWLETFLQSYEGGVILVSHDKTLLDKMTNRTIEITTGKIYDFKAPYSEYLVQREERRQIQMNAKKNQEKYIEHTEKLIDKFRAKKDKASFAQSLIKKLDRLEKVEVDDSDNKAMAFRFPPAPHSGRIVLTATHVSKRYGEKEVLHGVDLVVERGQKIAFAGRNGEGKSTLVKIIANELPYEGLVEMGYQVIPGYFAQNQAELLDPDLTVFETIDQIAVGEVRKDMRNLLGSFLFSGDDVFKKVKVLSGGERNRLALCKLLLEPRNLLILDEPTNHLDLASKAVLKKALEKFDGTLLLVSHDRDFLDGLTEKTIYFRDKGVKEILGGISVFLDKLKSDSLYLESGVLREKKLKKPEKEFKDTKIAEAKTDEKELKRLRSQIAAIEETIALAEDKVRKLEEKLSDPELFSDPALSSTLLNEHAELKKANDVLLRDWERMQEELEKRQTS